MSSPKYAGFWIRFVADIIDSLLLNVVTWLIQLVLTGACYWIWFLIRKTQGGTLPPFDDAFNAIGLQVLNLVIYVSIAAPYYIWGHYRYGTTLGKWPLGIYVVTASDQQPISMKQSILRFTGYGISYAVVFAGFLMAAFQPEKRGFHDLLAGTVSVIKRSPKKSELIAEPTH